MAWFFWVHALLDMVWCQKRSTTVSTSSQTSLSFLPADDDDEYESDAEASDDSVLSLGSLDYMYTYSLTGPVANPGKRWTKKKVDGRCYAVWKTTGSGPDIRGVHVGPNAWYGIRERLHNKIYNSGKDRLCGYDSYQLALAGYTSYYRKHGAPFPFMVYNWS